MPAVALIHSQRPSPNREEFGLSLVLEFRGSFDVVHFRYGPSVHLPQLPTPPRGDAVEVVFRREQPNSTGGTRTHAKVSFAGACSVISCS